jgi:hypothetical protein
MRRLPRCSANFSLVFSPIPYPDMGVLEADYEKLLAASETYKTEDPYGPAQIEDIMQAIFGDYSNQENLPDAVEWKD